MSTTPWPLPFWVAHRGAGKLAPENTLAAFRLGAAHGFRAFECDVRLSADGIPFLLHDATLERSTSGRGLAAEQPWATLAQLDAGGWHSRAYAGEPPASLDGLAAYALANDLALNLELKPNAGQARRTGQVVGEAALRLWGEQAPARLLLSSFQPEALEGAREAAPALPRGLLLEQLRPGWLEQALALGCRAVVTHYPLMEAALVAQLHAAGLKALVYTANDPATVQWLIANGVDGVITDAVDRFSPASR